MRPTLAVLGIVIAAPAALAQTSWVPAPVPAIGAGNNVMPPARAGRSIGPERDAPFSGIPTRSTAADSTTSSNQVNGAKTPDLSPR